MKFTQSHHVSRTLALALAATLTGSAALAQGSDACASAQVLNGTGIFSLDNTSATTDPCITACAGEIFNDVWFSWTSSGDGPMAVANCNGTAFDTKIAVYDATAGCPGPGTELVSDDDTCGSQSVVSFRPTPNTTYYIRIGSAVEGQTGSGSWTLFPAGEAGVSFCESVANSTGSAARIWVEGSDSLFASDLTLHAAPIPNEFYVFFYGGSQAQQPFGNGGTLCVGGSMIRIGDPQIACNNHARVQVFDHEIPPAGPAHFQCWFRDPAITPDRFNTSDAYTVNFF